MKKYTGNIGLAIAKPLIIAIAAMYLFFLKIFVLRYFCGSNVFNICYIHSSQGVLFSSHLKLNKKSGLWDQLFYAVFAMKSKSMIKPRTSSLLTDVLSLKPVCQKAGVTEILTLWESFPNTKNNDLKVRYFWLTGVQKYVFSEETKFSALDLYNYFFVYVITIFLTFSS